MTRLGQMGQSAAPAGTGTKVRAALLLWLLCAPGPVEAGEQGESKAEERARRKEERAQAQLEKKRAAWRRLPAYELGRREGLAEAAAQCAAQGKVIVPPDPQAKARPAAAPAADWRAEPLYTAARARRPFMNGYLSCLRAHGHDPRHPGDLPIAPPPMPPLEEDLPPVTDAERDYVGQHASELWEDGVRRCEQDLKGR